jgi:ubiquinone/menaquinone biosynthesis C-methylase UbiE
MTEYLDFEADLNDPEVVSLCDELSLWSAPFGLMLLSHIEMKHGLQVLDVGFGTGFPLFELAHRLGATCRVIGIDVWEGAVARAQGKLRRYGLANVEVLHADGAAMPFEDQSFDWVVANLAINNFGDPQAVLGECARVLKPAGRMALTTNPKGHMAEFYDVFRQTLREMKKEEVIAALERHLDTRFPLATLQAFFERAGIKPAKVHEDSFVMRFVDGSAFLRHFLILLGFMDAWRALLAPGDRQEIFSRLEANLNRLAETRGEIAVTIPMLYLEGEKVR